MKLERQVLKFSQVGGDTAGGFTLLELIIAVAILAGIMAITGSTMVTSQRMFVAGTSANEAQRSAQMAIDWIGSELIKSGIDSGSSNEVEVFSVSGAPANPGPAIHFQKRKVDPATNQLVWSNYFVIKGFEKDETEDHLRNRIVMWEDNPNPTVNLVRPGPEDRYYIIANTPQPARTAGDDDRDILRCQLQFLKVRATLIQVTVEIERFGAQALDTDIDPTGKRKQKVVAKLITSISIPKY